MKAKLQKFGGSLYTPVLFTAFAGMMAGLSIVFNDPNFFGSLTDEGTLWYGFWYLIGEGAWTIFRQMPIIFAVGIPIGLVRKNAARAALESILAFLTFNYYIQTIIVLYNDSLSFDPTGPGMTEIAGITTFDMSIFGAIIIALIVSAVHDRFFDKELPEFLGTFSGSVFVYVILFFLLIPVAGITVIVWPIIAEAISNLQSIIIASGGIGVGLYTFLERILIPTGLHHLIYQPFEYGSVVVDGGAKAGWIEILPTLKNSTLALNEAYPAGGYLMFGLSKVFGTLGMAFAFYFTAKPEKKKRTLGLLIPITLTAMLVGVTEPFEFSFLFVAPVLFVVHAALAGIMTMVMYMIGLSGDFGAGLINFLTLNWLPLGSNYWFIYLLQIVIGLGFSVIYFIVFKYLILKYDFKTPGREDEEEVKFYTKKEYKERNLRAKESQFNKDMEDNEIDYQLIAAFGGIDNIVSISNCATRLRIEVVNGELVAELPTFKALGAHGIVKNKNAIQVIIGLNVPKVRDSFEKTVENERMKNER